MTTTAPTHDAKAHGKANGTSHDKNQIVEIAIADIHADGEWNSRQGKSAFSYDATPQTDGKLESTEVETRHAAGGGTGFAGLVTSLKEDGQDTPVIVRPLPERYKNVKKAFALTAGFRRFKAVEMISADGIPIPGISKPGFIRATIIVEDETAAFKRNVRENTAREDLTGAELCFAVRRMADSGLTQKQIGDSLEKAQSYVSRLLAITDAKDGIKDKKILASWRDGTDYDGKASANGRLTLDEMTAITKMPSNDQPKAYTEKCTAVDAKGKGKVTKKNAWAVNAKAKAEDMGRVLGVAAYHGVIPDTAAVKKALGDVDTASHFVLVTCPARKGMTEKQRDSATEKAREGVAAALVKGYETGKADAKKEVDRRAKEKKDAAEAAGADEGNE